MDEDTIIKNRLLLDDKHQRRILRLLGSFDSETRMSWLAELDHYEYYFEKFELIESAIQAELESIQAKSAELSSYSTALGLEMEGEKEKIATEKSKIESKKVLNTIADSVHQLPSRSVLVGNINALESEISSLYQALDLEKASRAQLKAGMREAVKACLAMRRKLDL